MCHLLTIYFWLGPFHILSRKIKELDEVLIEVWKSRLWSMGSPWKFVELEHFHC